MEPPSPRGARPDARSFAAATTGASGWDSSMPVIIASNRLPVRVTRRAVAVTPPTSPPPSPRRYQATGHDDQAPAPAPDGQGDSNGYQTETGQGDANEAAHGGSEGAGEDASPSPRAERYEWHVEWAGDRVIEAQNSFSHYEISNRATIKFVGRVPEWDVPVDEQAALAAELRAFNCYPVFVPAEEARLYYEEYCKQSLWPTFHNVIDVYSPIDVAPVDRSTAHTTSNGLAGDTHATDKKDAVPSSGNGKPVHYWTPEIQKQAWQAYANVNQLIANQICDLYEPGDVIWVQDYHLLLTPSYIIRKLRNANIGLFLHVPFPSSEVFRTLSTRKEILRGMLNADHIGFHLFEYARHFMSACKRILGLTYHPILRGQLGIEYGGRRVAVTCSHMAIDATRIQATLAEDSVRERVVELRQRYQGKTILVGCDTVERLKGIPFKVLAFDSFLSRCPDFVGKVVLVQKGIHRRGRAYDYAQSKKEIEFLVASINTKYYDRAGGNVIDYEELDEFPFRDRLALWRVGDVQITTVLRDGLNNSPFEYIVTHKTAAGVVILSEFSGSSRLLSGALTVNPWELDQVIDAIRDAMYMSPKEREHRRDCDFQFVSMNPPRRWATCVLHDIVSSRKKEDEYVYMGTGFGLDFRVMEVSARFRKLSPAEMSPAYRTSKSRAIFLDYYRTLAPDVSKVMGVRWPDVSLNALSTLEHLCTDPRNAVFVVSGCNCDVLTEKFGGVPGLGLVAEHGYYIRRAVLGQGARIMRPWERRGGMFDTETANRKWREKAEKIIELYVNRTNGSSIERRKSAVLFRYGKSDLEFGVMQAAELKEHLESVFENWPLDVIQGKDYIELRPEGVGKGKVIGSILETMRTEGNEPDFVLCIGDDIADELMFEKLNELTAQSQITRERVFTCTVGQKPSKAEFFVDDYTDVISLLKSLTVLSTKSNRNYSLSDMQSFVRTDTRPLMASSIQSAGFTRNSSSDSSFRRTSSRYSLQHGLSTVMEEDQSALGDGSSVMGGLSPNPDRQSSWLANKRRRRRWSDWLQRVAAVIMVAAVLVWRKRVQNPQDRKLITYIIASLGAMWSIQRVRYKRSPQ